MLLTTGSATGIFVKTVASSVGNSDVSETRHEWHNRKILTTEHPSFFFLLEKPVEEPIKTAYHGKRDSCLELTKARSGVI